MKTFSLFLILTLSVLKFYGQSYTPLIDTNSVWKERWDSWCSVFASSQSTTWWKSQEEFKGDTVIGSYNYSKLKLTGYKYHHTYYFGNITDDSVLYCNYYIGGIREDTLLKQVFYIDRNGTESLLYNFNLNVGDSLIQDFGDNYSYYTYVQSIDSIFIVNKYRKRFNMYQNEHYPYDLTLVEGIGSNFGLLGKHLSPNSQCFSPEGDRLYAYFYDSTNVFGLNPTEILDNCTSLSVERDITLTPIINVFPNPATNILTIENIPRQATIEIYNIQGQIILQKQLQQGTTDIDISRLAKGVYILKFLSNDRTEVRRIEKE